MKLLLDTRAVTAADRVEYWSTGMSDRFFSLHVESYQPAAFDARVTGGDVGPMSVAAISGLPHRVARTTDLINESDPERMLFYLVRRGTLRLEQGGRTCELRTGEFAGQDTSTPSAFHATSGFDVLMLAVPKWLLGDLNDTIAARTATRVGGVDSPLVRFAAPMLAGLERTADRDGMPSDAGAVVAEMLLPLLHALYVADESDRLTRGAVLLEQMRQYALAHLSDPDLGPEQLARVHYVSVRYVHKLFAPLGGVSTWIRERRLEGAAHDLRSTERTVSEIAARWGYRDPSSFARAFRHRTGLSPSGVRAA